VGGGFGGIQGPHVSRWLDARNNHVHEIIPKEAISGLSEFHFCGGAGAAFVFIGCLVSFGGFTGVFGFVGDARTWVRLRLRAGGMTW
jgi:hypothetical protein